MAKNGFVYIVTNKSRSILCTGVAGDLVKRIHELKSGSEPGVAASIRAAELVYFETAGNMRSAVAREKHIRADSRRNKLDLVDAMNPEWRDLSDDISRLLK